MNQSTWLRVISQSSLPGRRAAKLATTSPANCLRICAVMHFVILWTALVRRQTPVTKLGVKSQPGACQCGHKLGRGQMAGRESGESGPFRDDRSEGLTMHKLAPC